MINSPLQSSTWPRNPVTVIPEALSVYQVPEKGEFGLAHSSKGREGAREGSTSEFPTVWEFPRVELSSSRGTKLDPPLISWAVAKRPFSNRFQFQPALVSWYL